MLTDNPLTGYGISNLELLLILLVLGVLAGAGFGLLRRRWRDEVHRRESALAEVQRQRDGLRADLAVADERGGRLQCELADVQQRREQLQGDLAGVQQEVGRLRRELAEMQRQRELEESRFRRELEEARDCYDPVRIKDSLEQSEREIAHRFGSRLFDIAERCRETVPRVRPDQPDLRIVLNEVGAQTREMLHESKLLVGLGSLRYRKPVWETLRVRSVLEGVVKEQLAYAEARSVSLLTDYSSVCPIRTDRVWLHDLCEVVIHNAIKFSPEFVGVARITLRPEDDGERRLFIDVQDNGCGIDPKDHERIFERNVRGDGQRVPGGGLGLGYGSGIAAGIGGNLVLVESTKEGSLFRIILPCSGQEDAPPPGAAQAGGKP